VLEIATDIARGMAYMHSRGLLHGDLASKNVLLTRYSSTHTPKDAPAPPAAPKWISVEELRQKTMEEEERADEELKKRGRVEEWEDEADRVGFADGLLLGTGLGQCYGGGGSAEVTAPGPNASVSESGVSSEAELETKDQGRRQPAGRLVAKVADFGLSRMMPLGVSHMSTLSCGTVTHQAPELLQVSG
jgi:serine/threonine protein kinase